MKKIRFVEDPIAFALRQAESGTAAEEITRKGGISEATFYRWKKKCAGMEALVQSRSGLQPSRQTDR